MSFLATYLPHTVTLAERQGATGYGDPLPGAAQTEQAARIEDVYKVMSVNGEEVQVTAIVYTDAKVAVGTFFWFGARPGYDADDTSNASLAKQPIMIEAVPSVRGNTSLFKHIF